MLIYLSENSLFSMLKHPPGVDAAVKCLREIKKGLPTWRKPLAQNCSNYDVKNS